MQKVKAVLAVGVVIFLVALMVSSTTRPVDSSRVAWNIAMTKGNPETGKHFIMYTDIFCPYCDKFSNALHANADDFNANYIDNGQIYYEMRITDMNYYTGHSNNSRPAGESMYCAARQDKFWDYYQALLDKLYEDFHSKGIGVDRTSPSPPELELSYYFDVAETVSLRNEAFVSCLENNEALEELTAATTKAQKQIEGGVPYFVFGNFRTSGFDGNWNTTNDYRQSRRLLDAGLQS